MLSKEEVFAELEAFLIGYGESVSRIYGEALPTSGQLDVQATTLWKSMALAYDFGVEGTLALSKFNLHLTDGALNPDVSDADMLFHGLSSMQMQTFMSEDAVHFPSKCAKVVDTAIARHVLYGGSRDAAWEADLPPDGYLTIAEVALLANMDERSVRNAATKGAGEGRLVTVQVGKRSLVDINAARRWLSGRKAFVPTLDASTDQGDPTLTKNTLRLLAKEAKTAGLSVDEFVHRRLLAS